VRKVTIRVKRTLAQQRMLDEVDRVGFSDAPPRRVGHLATLAELAREQMCYAPSRSTPGDEE
jgi:hypothetical protein